MLKIVIVDDEMMVRVGFSSCIKWEDYGCQVVAACESGESAVLLFQKEPPDIVFTDIMMPEMNGIELVEHIRKYYPATKVVVLSCSNEIEYVKQAIRLGAEDYILKLSFTSETLIELIARLKESIAKERRQKGEDEIYREIQSFNREQGFCMLVSGNLSPGDSEALLDKLGCPYDPFERYQTGCFVIDDFRAGRGVRDIGAGDTGVGDIGARDTDSGDTDVSIMRYGLLNIMREYMGKLPRFELAFVSEMEIMVLFRLRQGESVDEVFPDLLTQLNHALKTHLNLTLSMGLDHEYSKRTETALHYRRARELAGLRFFTGGGSFHREEENGGNAAIPRRNVQMGIQEAVFRQDEEAAFAMVDQWFGEMGGFRNYEQIAAIRRLVVEAWIIISGSTWQEQGEASGYDELYSMDSFWEAGTMEELKTCFKEAVRAVLDYLGANKTANPEIRRLLHYLEHHVDESISLERAAAWCALGKSQFCILFKKQTGDSFVNYFNRIKMKKAFALLGGGNVQVQEAADRVGIRDISYFSRLFKKYYHISPSEVRKL